MKNFVNPVRRLSRLLTLDRIYKIFHDLQELLPTGEYNSEFIFFIRLDVDEWRADGATIQSDHVHHRLHRGDFVTLATCAQRVEWDHAAVQQICERGGVAGVGELPKLQRQ